MSEPKQPDSNKIEKRAAIEVDKQTASQPPKDGNSKNGNKGK